jgi:hypothetical protein
MLRGIAQFTFKLHEEGIEFFRSFTSKYLVKLMLMAIITFTG